MSVLTSLNPLLIVVAAGLGCHLVFKCKEPSHPLSHFSLLVVVPGLLTPLIYPRCSDLVLAICTVFTTYLTTLTLSIFVYRLAPFHPLAGYPGPILCKLSKFWMVWVSAEGKQHLYYQDLHRRYGDVVRIGPNELSICDPSAITPLMGHGGLPKGPAWDGRNAEQRVRSLIGLRDLHEHARRRRPWNRAFSTAALKDYESIIARRASQLVAVLLRQSDSVDLAQWISYFAYDFMSDMAFGGGSEMMRDGDGEGLWHLLENAQPTALILGHIPWVGEYYIRLPAMGVALKAFRTFAAQRAGIRRAQGSLKKDLFHYLNNEDAVDPVPPTMAEVVSGGGLAIIAGSDTTATTLSNVFWFLLLNPKAYVRLQAEIDKYFPYGENALDTAQHTQMHYLNAVINEALRLFPPVPSGSQRALRKGDGRQFIGPCLLLEGTSAFVPPYSLHRDPRNFSPLPDSFLPERWLSAKTQLALEPAFFKASDQVVHNLEAFIPFSFGPSNCVGKNLAYQEMRMVICLLMQTFDMRFADGFEPAAWERTLQDFFVMTKGRLNVTLSPRKFCT